MVPRAGRAAGAVRARSRRAGFVTAAPVVRVEARVQVYVCMVSRPAAHDPPLISFIATGRASRANGGVGRDPTGVRAC